MKEYFVERENLAKMADSLIAQKYPGQPKEELEDLREKTIDRGSPQASFRRCPAQRGDPPGNGRGRWPGARR